jgi:hypothetical protein
MTWETPNDMAMTVPLTALSGTTLRGARVAQIA